MKRARLPSFLIVSLVLLALAGSSTSLRRAPVAESAYPAPDLSADILMYCAPDNTVSILLRWTTFDLGQQWVDLSVFDNGFEAGTFLGMGPLPGGQSAAVWYGLLPGTWHFARVNALTTAGWLPSETVFFYTRDDCASQGALRAIPPPPDCVASLTSAALTGCVWTTKPDYADYVIGETVVYCYVASQPTQATVVVTKPDTSFVVIDGVDLGTGACIGPYQAASPRGLRTIDLYGAGGQLLSETHFFVR